MRNVGNSIMNSNKNTNKALQIKYQREELNYKASAQHTQLGRTKRILIGKEDNNRPPHSICVRACSLAHSVHRRTPTSISNEPEQCQKRNECCVKESVQSTYRGLGNQSNKNSSQLLQPRTQHARVRQSEVESKSKCLSEY